jgi:CheY-like chemotaxis protein
MLAASSQNPYRIAVVPSHTVSTIMSEAAGEGGHSKKVDGDLGQSAWGLFCRSNRRYRLAAPMTAHVLTVETDPVVRADLRLILEDAGFDVSDARDGIEAVELARTQRPDLILIDLSLPRIDGVDVPIVEFVKPLHEEQLVGTIAGVLAGAERERQGQLIMIDSLVRRGLPENEIADALRRR